MVCRDDERARITGRLRWAAAISRSIAVASGGEALAVVKQQYLDGIVIDVRTGRISPPLQLVEEIQAQTGAA